MSKNLKKVFEAKGGDIMLAKRKIIKYPLSVRAEISRNRSDIEAHWHDDCEFIEIVGGTAEVCVGLDKYEAKAGDIFFVSDKTAHAVIRASEDFCSRHLVFDDTGAMRIASGNVLNSALLAGSYGFDGTVNEMERELGEKASYYEHAVTNLLTMLVIDVMRGEPHSRRDNAYEEPTFGKLLQKIEDCYEFFSFEDAAAFMNLSPVYFSAMFHKHVGMTFSKYINGVRVEKAVKMLQRPGIKITDVAMSCGFDTIRNFNYVFRKYTGHAPKQIPDGYRFENGCLACATEAELSPPRK